jgi:hypothetical protein
MRLLPVLAVFTAPLVSAACGSEQGASSPDAFPVTLTRQGGVAGVLQGAVVSRQGEVTLTGKGHDGTCHLAPKTIEQLSALARAATGTATTTPAHPDDLVVVLETPQGSKRFSDAELSGSAAVVTRLLDDVLKAPAERTLCT